MASFAPFRPLTPDTDPTGRFGYGTYGAAPSLNAPSLQPLPWNQPGGATPTTGGGGGGTAGSSGFDWKKLLNELLGPLRMQFYGESGMGGERGVDAATRAAALQRGYVQFGENPDFNFAASELGLSPEYAGDITEEARGLARQNTTAGLSILARLKEARTDALRQIKNTLAARGMLRSGETGFQLGRGEQEASRAQYDARQELLDYFAGVQAAFAQAERERARMLATSGLGLFGQIPFGSFDPGGGGDGGGTAPAAVAPPVALPAPAVGTPTIPGFPFGAGPTGGGPILPRRKPGGFGFQAM